MKINISLGVNYKDLYGKGFQDFMSQYKRVKESSSLYVQFTNYKDNTLDKNYYNDPDHHDPAGVYGYPLHYVLKYPADIWYGQNCKFLRVLRAIDYRHCLNVQDLNTEHAAIGFINKFCKTGETYEQFDYAKKYIKQNYNETARLNAKAAFLCVQNIFERDNNSKKIIATQRTPLQQNALLIKNGYTCVLDTAKSHKTAVINDREPEQIIFLSKKSFVVVDIFLVGEGSGCIVVQRRDEDLQKKLAALIFSAMGDKLYQYKSNDNLYWSKGGFCATVIIMYKNIDDGLKIGQKRHRASTFGNLKSISIKIECDAGVMEYEYDNTEFVVIATAIASDYRKRPKDTMWKPLSLNLYTQAIEQQKRQRIDEYKTAMYNEADEYYDEIEPLYNKIAKYYNQPELSTKNDQKYDHYDTLITLSWAFEDCIEGSTGHSTRYWAKENESLHDQYYALCGFLTQFYYEPWFRIKGGDYKYKLYAVLSIVQNIVAKLKL